MRRSILVLTLLGFLFVGSGPASAQLRDQVPPPGTPKAVAAPQPAKPPTPPQPPPAPQPPLPPEPGQAPQPTPAPQPRGLPINVKIELTIGDQLGSAAPVQKTVNLMVADRHTGMIRSEGMLPGYGKVQLHVDAEVRIIAQAEGKILTLIQLYYDLIDPKAAVAERQSQTTQIRESLRTILENGKSMTVSQSADPVTDRKVTVELKATIMK